MAEVRLETTGEDRGAGDLLEKLERQVEDLRREVERLSGKPLDIPTDPADAALKELRAELRRLEGAFDRAERALNFARTRNEIEGTTASARRLAAAESVLAARGKELIAFSRRLPPELRRTSGEMDRLERETEQAASAFRRFQATSSTTGRGLGGLISSIGQLRAGFGALIAALGVQQLLRGARALVGMGQSAVETKIQFDRLIPGLRAFAGSTELANEVADRLSATADRLKTPLAGLVNPLLAIQAGGREAGLSISEINDLFEASLLSARAFGKGADEVQRLLTGISQVAGKGVASMEEFRQQIGEAIPNAIPALAKGLSIAEGRIVSTAEAIARISSGSLDSAKALRALTVGFEQLNAAAAEEQLETFLGVLGALERQSEKIKNAFGEGLVPGLRVLFEAVQRASEGNEALVESLGAIAGAAIEPAASLFDMAKALQIIARSSDESKARIEGLFDGLAAGLSQVPGLQLLSGAVGDVGRAFTGTAEEAKKAFQEIEDRARQLVLGTNESAEDILERWRRTFEEQAKAAGAADEEIEQNAKDLADVIGDIAEKSQKEREALEKARVEVNKGSLEQIQAFEEFAAKRIREIEEQVEAERKKAIEELVKSTKEATDERIRLEAEAAAAALAEAQKITEGARESAQQRIETDEELHTRRQELEAEAAEKILEAQQDFVERLKKPKADRKKLAQELADKVIEIELDLADKIAAEQEKVAKAAEEASKRRIAAEQAVQAEYQDSIDDLRELVDTLNEAAQGPEGEGGGLQQVADQAGEIREELEGASLALGEFIVSLEDVNAGNLGNPLDALQGPDPRSGQAAADFFGSFGAGAEQAEGQVADFGETLRAALEIAESASGGPRQAILDLIDRFADLAGSGDATLADQQAFADGLAAIGAQFSTSFDDPVARIKERLEELKGSQSDATTSLQEAQARQEEAYQAVADAAGETGDAAEEAGQRTDVAFNEATNTMESVASAAEGAGEAVEEAGQRIEETADGITVTNEALGETEAAGTAAAEGLAAVSDAADGVTDALAGAGEAIDPLKGEIVGEGEPEKLRDLGAAAAEALPSIQPLAEPVQTLAEAAAALSTSLPIITENLPVIAQIAGELLATIGESEIDFGAIAEQIGALAEPLTSISASLPVISEAVASLPEPITAVSEAAAPLFDAALAAAEDDRFGRIGQGLASIAAVLPPIPEPMERLQTVLEKIVDQREDIEAALQATAGGLAAVAAEEILAGLAELVDSLDEALGLISELDETTKSWQSTLAQIVEDVPELVFKLGELADRARDDLAPGLTTAAEASEFLREDLSALEAASDSTFASVIEDAKAATEALKETRVEAQGLAADLRDVAAAATEAAAATASIAVGS